MKKTIGLISVTVLGILASLLLVLAGNMFFGDVANISAGMITGLFVTLPAAALTVDVIALFLAVIGYFVSEKTHKKLFKVNLLTIAISSGVGLIGALLAGIVTYHSFTKPYPFPGFLIIFMIAHLLVIASCVYGLVFCIKKMPEDQEAFKVTVGHVFKTIGWFLFVSLTLNRFGMFVISPLYIEWRTFGMTFVFYLYLLVPLALGIYKVLKLLGFIGEGLGNTIFAISMEVINLALCAVIVILGSTHSEFISAVSPALGLERISSMPFEIIIHFASYTGVVTMMLVQSLKRK